MGERTFSEEQIQSLLKRATQLHLQDEGDRPGLNLKDLEHIAADAGVPPQYLRAALQEADNQVSSRDVSGHTKTHVYIDRVIPGELTDDEWEQVVLRVRKEYSNDMAEAYGMGAIYGRGVTEMLGKSREWRHTSSMGVVTTLTIRSAEGKQFINIQRRVGLSSPRVEGLAYGALLALLATGIAGAILQSVLASVLVFAAALAICAPAVETLDRRWREKMLREMHGVTDDIAELVRNEEESGAEPEAMLEQPSPLLDLSEAEPAQTEESSAKSSIRSR
jgi:hypothetical protein